MYLVVSTVHAANFGSYNKVAPVVPFVLNAALVSLLPDEQLWRESDTTRVGQSTVAEPQ